ncbi:hypothetical protein BTHE_0378 [Bifidobacterium thermophilum]|nr:hypothetical protein BTHE_0378 [Bifidobacterium thermophilum]
MRTPDSHNLPRPVRENMRQLPNPSSSPKTISFGESVSRWKRKTGLLSE